MPTPPTPATPAHAHKSVTFCACEHHESSSDQEVKYYSDPPKPKPRKDQLYSTDSDQKYYSEPDAKYFEIDYEFLKELRKIARNNCPKCRRKRSRRNDKERSRKDKRSNTLDTSKYTKSLDRPKYVKTKKPTRSVRLKENYVFCNGRYHSDKEHCQLCCRVCNRSTDTLDSIDDEYSLVSKSYSSNKASSSRSKSNPPRSNSSRDSKNSTLSRERKNSIQSIKSVSFLESSTEEKDETNYTAKSFTNDLKKFLLRPSTPRLSFRDKFINSFKQEIEATKKSPKLKSIKGLWKSY